MVARLETKLQRSSDAQIEATGAKWGRALYRFVAKRRNTALGNLALAFPELPEAERADLALRSFEHFGIVSADFLAGRGRTRDTLERGATIEGRDNLEAALAQGKGVLLVTGHYGNWERAAAWISRAGYKLNVVIRDADQQGVNQRVNAIRESAGTTVIPRGDAGKPILTALRRNEIVGILSDQNHDDAFLPFFGHPAGTNLGIGVIAERTGAPLIPLWTPRVGVGQYRFIFDAPLAPVPGDHDKGVATLLAVHTWLEGIIRQYPEQWLWMHDRWRAARRKGLLSP